MIDRRSNFFIRFVLLLLFVSFVNTGQELVAGDKTNSRVLARVEVTGMLDDLNLPVYAHLSDAAGREYALVIAPEKQLDRADVQYRILDKHAGKAEYFILSMFAPDQPLQTHGLDNILMDDGEHVIVRGTFKDVEAFVALGIDVQRLNDTPMVLEAVAPPPDISAVTALTYDAAVARMINQVTQSGVNTYINGLTGETPVTVGGSSYTIVSRHTVSGTPIDKATQYVYEFMDGLGLTVSYHNWSRSGYTGRNVIGELTGTTQPDEIVLITAHLDCMPSGSINYGADDNGSGSVGVMMSAEKLSGHAFTRTVRFIFFTGEEQGLLGSYEYSNMIYANGDNVVAVYNMDMLGYDGVGGPVLGLHTRYTSNPGYPGDLAVANTFVDVVNTYGLDSVLSPYIDADNETRSDHNAFWNNGYPGILGIEDIDGDMTPYYHSTSDRASTLNMTYFTNFVKASVGTAAHLAVPDSGTLTADFSGTPTSGEAPLTVAFTDLSTGNPDTWDWTFTGGTPGTSSLQDPVITYNAPGTYTVTLTASNASDSDTETKVGYITVEAASVCPGSITNPGFETGGTSGWTVSGSVGLTSGSHSGSYAVSVNGADSAVEQVVIDLCANTTYTVSCWGKAKSTAGVYLGVRNYGGAEKTVKFTNSKNFAKKSITFTTGATNTSATVFFRKSSKKFTGIADDFEIIKN